MIIIYVQVDFVACLSLYWMYQGRIEPARGHATSNSAIVNIDSIVLNVTEILVLRVGPPIP